MKKNRQVRLYLAPLSHRRHGETFCKINDVFKLVIGIVVNGHIPTSILTMIAHCPRQNTCWNASIYYRIPTTYLKVSCKLQNF